MKFLYKIYSAYDGFRPRVIPNRMVEGRLRLRWHHYIDLVERGWECWIYFHGPHRFENGVYAQGIVDAIDLDEGEVTLRIRDYSTERPLTTPEISERVAQVIAPRYRQVFAWPDEWNVAAQCSLDACKRKQCGDCATWSGLPLIDRTHTTPPRRLRWSTYHDVVPAYWFVPKRCYETRINPTVQHLTVMFTAFKLGEKAYTYPFARAMYEQLRRRDLLDFNYVVPIPLSPEKANKGEFHRTRELAKELGRLLAVRMLEMLELTTSVSKRQVQALGVTTAQFEVMYLDALQATVPADAGRILLVDDAMTKGSTVAQAIRALQRQWPGTSIVVATAGQMIVMEAVLDDAGFRT